MALFSLALLVSGDDGDEGDSTGAGAVRRGGVGSAGGNPGGLPDVTGAATPVEATSGTVAGGG
jgi:hypothetical protein